MAKKMELVEPKIERSEELRDYGKFTIGPLERGFGVTLGNALRRVLLSSLEGAAVTTLHVADVMHEFSTIPGVREDVIQVMLNIKELRFKLHNVDTANIHLEVRGQGTITGADIECPPEVEIINPESYLFSISENDAHVEMEMTVKKGRGFVPASDRSDHLAIGVLPVDAIFSPVRRVNWEVTSARVGHSTDYDRLTLEIWTDGTISPEKALIGSSEILRNQLDLISGTDEERLTKPVEEVQPEQPALNRDVIETPIEALDLGVRVFNSLKRTGITTIGDVLELFDKGESAMLSIRNFGDKSLAELKDRMIAKEYWKEDELENE